MSLDSNIELAGPIKPYIPRKFDPIDCLLRERISSKAVLGFTAAECRWSIRQYRGSASIQETIFWFRVNLVSGHWRVGIDCWGLQTFLGQWLGDVDLRALDNSLLLCMLNDAIAEAFQEHSVFNSLEMYTTPIADEQNSLVCFEIAKEVGAEENPSRFFAWLELDEARAHLITCKFKRNYTTALPDLLDLQLTTWVEIGRISITILQYESLSPGSLLIADEGGPPGSGPILLRLSQSHYINVELNGASKFESISGIKIMKEYSDAMISTNGDNNTASLADLAIIINFSMGSTSLSLRELYSIEPGYVFNIGLQPSSAIRLCVNGQCIGEGEVVDIAGRLGVIVTRITVGRP